MSVSTVDIIMGRIVSARKDSPIAVFKVMDGDKKGCLDAVFAATVNTQKLINNNHPGLVGVFDQTMDRDDVESKLLSA